MERSTEDLPQELFLTFEDGLHVGVFHDREGAERLNEMRRKKRGVNPVTARYVLAPENDEKETST